MLKWAPVVVALALTSIADHVHAEPFTNCTSESFKTGGLARGEGEGVWVPSDFLVAFDCAALGGNPPDPTPIYALFNSLFGFDPTFELPPGEFEIDTEGNRPLYQFIPERPEAFGQWWQAQLGAPSANHSPAAGVLGFIAVGLLAFGLWRFWAPRGRLDAGAESIAQQ